ncbi:hypothetical protein OUZ56_018484 [Daphnia magna]|uniref:Uncharacterized protein n=1 Tax=Daphnia magna TaxID=35525 RepID=A0ABQ9Z8Y8_9CRUS|nr:hypothetical protein OUZ56_018484 [Daphnia magna]
MTFTQYVSTHTTTITPPSANSLSMGRLRPLVGLHTGLGLTVPLDSFLLLQKDSRRAALHPSFSVNGLQEWAYTAHVLSVFPDFVDVELDERLPIWRYPQLWSKFSVRVGYRLLFAGGYRHRKHTEICKA